MSKEKSADVERFDVAGKNEFGGHTITLKNGEPVLFNGEMVSAVEHDRIVAKLREELARLDVQGVNARFTKALEMVVDLYAIPQSSIDALVLGEIGMKPEKPKTVLLKESESFRPVDVDSRIAAANDEFDKMKAETKAEITSNVAEWAKTHHGPWRVAVNPFGISTDGVDNIFIMNADGSAVAIIVKHPVWAHMEICRLQVAEAIVDEMNAAMQPPIIHECPMDKCLAPTREDVRKANHERDCARTICSTTYDEFDAKIKKYDELLRQLRKVVACGVFGIPQEEATKYIGLITDLIPPETSPPQEK